MPPDHVHLDQLRRVLVIKLRHHGDVLLSSPVFSVLKNHAPQVEIDALVYADTAPMLAFHPCIETVYTIDRSWKGIGLAGRVSMELSLLSRLSGRRYDLIIHLTESWRGAWLSRLLGPKWSVGPEKRGGGARWRNSFTHIVSPPRAGGRHVVESNLDALRRIGIQPTKNERGLVLEPGEKAKNEAKNILHESGLFPGRFVHIHPGSRWQFKCWTLEGWSEVVRRLHELGWPVVFTAAPDAAEISHINALRERLDFPVTDLSGRLDLKGLAAITEKARLFIGVDSAPMHIAAAMCTPTVVLFGPSGSNLWGPWGKPRQGRHRVVTSNQHSCRPCGIDGCGGGKVSDCLATLPVDVVWDAIIGSIEETE